MPVISAEPVQTNCYRVSFMVCNGLIENVIVTPDGLYSLSYIKNCQMVTNTGRILNIAQNRASPNKSYFLFDCSKDMSSKKERVYFFQIQYIKDITENDAYRIAVKHGFEGTVEEWLASLRGDPGKSAYELAVDCGFSGTEEEWLDSIRGIPGLSAYEVAVKNGFTGTEAEWLKSLKGDSGDPGKSAYELAKDHGYTGTEEEWLASIGDTTALKKDVDLIKDNLEWVPSMN